jgi:hypothetical protein
MKPTPTPMFISLIACCAVLLTSDAAATEVRQDRIDVIETSFDAGGTSRLQFEARCTSRQSGPRYPICIRDDGSDNPLSTYQDLAHRLRNGIDDVDALCAIDTSLVLSLLECPLVIPGSYLAGAPQFAFADLSQLLARNWQRQGSAERADQLYSQAYSLMEDSELGQDLGKLGILREWVSTRIVLGMNENATSLARLHTALARRYYNCNGGPWVVLVQSLQLQAETLRTFGNLAEAQTLQNEAKRLSASAEDCRGRCPGRPPSRGCN